MTDIHTVLRRIGVRRSYCGYTQIIKALEVVQENESRFTYITDVYRQVAEETGCRWQNVERNIRTIINHVWNSYADELTLLAGYRLDGKPTVAEFLEILHEALTVKERE